MNKPQTQFPRDLADMVEWVSSRVSPGQRVLEIGCGDGALIEQIAKNVACIAVGADPVGIANDIVRAVPFETLDEAPFDVIVSSVALHHLEDRLAATEALRRLSRPGTVFLVREFDWTEIDMRTNRWWFEQRPLLPRLTEQHHHDDEHNHGNHNHGNHNHGDHQVPATFEEFLAQWTNHMTGHIMSWAEVLELVQAAGFETTEERVTAWMFRNDLSDDHKDEEERLAAAGLINLVGRRWEGIRR